MSNDPRTPLNWYRERCRYGCGRDRGVADRVRAGHPARRARARLFPAPEAAGEGVRERRHPAVHRQYALHQHDPRQPAARIHRRPGHRAADQEHRPLERDGDGGAHQQEVRRPGRPHFDLLAPRHPVPGRHPSTSSAGAARAASMATCSTSRGTPRRASMPIRSSKDGSAWRRWRPSAASSRRAAGLSSYPHPWLMPDYWEFPTVSMGWARSPRSTRPSSTATCATAACAIPRAEDLGVPGRRRDRRARDSRRHHPGLPRAARQSDLRHQLQPAAARRPGARQRQDHPGAGDRLPRRRLERHQGDLGERLGPLIEADNTGLLSSG